MQEDFLEIVEKNAAKVLELLQSSSVLSSWDIKLKLKLSASQLYMALGYLIANKKIFVYPEELNYKVKLNTGQENSGQ